MPTRENETYYNSPSDIQLEASSYVPDVSNSIAQQRLDQEEIFDKLKHKMRGEEMVLEENKWQWKKTADELCNNLGINRIFNEIDGIVNPNTILSRFSTNEITNAMRIFHTNLTWQLILNRERFEINKNDMKEIIDLVTNTVWATLKRAEDGGESDAISGSVQTVERTIKDLKKDDNERKIPFLSGD